MEQERAWSRTAVLRYVPGAALALESEQALVQERAGRLAPAPERVPEVPEPEALVGERQAGAQALHVGARVLRPGRRPWSLVVRRVAQAAVQEPCWA